MTMDKWVLWVGKACKKVLALTVEMSVLLHLLQAKLNCLLSSAGLCLPLRSNPSSPTGYKSQPHYYLCKTLPLPSSNHAVTVNYKIVFKGHTYKDLAFSKHLYNLCYCVIRFLKCSFFLFFQTVWFQIQEIQCLQDTYFVSSPPFISWFRQKWKDQ